MRLPGLFHQGSILHTIDLVRYIRNRRIVGDDDDAVTLFVGQMRKYIYHIPAVFPVKVAGRLYIVSTTRL